MTPATTVSRCRAALGYTGEPRISAVRVQPRYDQWPIPAREGPVPGPDGRSVLCKLVRLFAVVALAQDISITTDPEARIECWTEESDVILLAVYTSGWEDNESISVHGRQDGQDRGGMTNIGNATNGVFDVPNFYHFPCDRGWLGEWRFRLIGETSGYVGEFTILVARGCAAALFVPEPETILLLGSGLAGLAGYATLLLRSGQALG